MSSSPGSRSKRKASTAPVFFPSSCSSFCSLSSISFTIDIDAFFAGGEDTRTASFSPLSATSIGGGGSKETEDEAILIVSVDLGGKAGVQTPFDDAGIATEEKEDDDDEDNDEGASALLNLPFFTDDVFFSFFSFFAFLFFFFFVFIVDVFIF